MFLYLISRMEITNYSLHVIVAQLCLTLCNLMDYMEFSRPEYWSGQPFPSPGDFSQPRDQTQVSHLVGRFLPAEPQGKPKNIRVGSLSFLQRIFPIQELNQGLLHCRQILYQLNYQRSPKPGGKLQSLTRLMLRNLDQVYNSWREGGCRCCSRELI